MKRSKGIQLGALLTVLLLVGILFVPIVGALGTDNNIPPNTNRPETKYTVDTAEREKVKQLANQMTEEKAIEILKTIPEPKAGEIIPLTIEQRAAATKMYGQKLTEQLSKRIIQPSPAASSNYRHAFIHTSEEKYTGASNLMSGYLPVLDTGTHQTNMALWFVDYVGGSPGQWAELGLIRMGYDPQRYIWTYHFDSDEGWVDLYDVVGSGTQVYFEILVLANNEYIAWINNRQITGKHVTATYNMVDMGGEQYNDNQQYATGDIGNVYQPQLLDNTGYRYWGSSVPTTPVEYYPMWEDHWDTSQGYRVYVYSRY